MLLRGFKASSMNSSLLKGRSCMQLLTRYGIGSMVTSRSYGIYSPERINQARKEMQRLQRLDQYGSGMHSLWRIGITLETLEQFGRNCDEKKYLLSAQFCFRELPIRTLLKSCLTLRIRLSYPWFRASTSGNVRHPHNENRSRLVSLLLYRYAGLWSPKVVFHVVIHPFRTFEEAVKFTDVLEKIYDRHSGVSDGLCDLFADNGDDCT